MERIPSSQSWDGSKGGICMIILSISCIVIAVVSVLVDFGLWIRYHELNMASALREVLEY